MWLIRLELRVVVLVTPQGGVAEFMLVAGVIARGWLMDVNFGLQQGMATVNQLSVKIIDSVYYKEFISLFKIGEIFSTQ